MGKKILSLICCMALCTPMVAMVQCNDEFNNSNAIVVSADTYNMKVSQNAIDLIKSCEGFSPKAYWDYKQWTIGYGTYVASDKTYPNGITEAQGEQMLYNAVSQFEGYVNSFLKRNNVTVNQNQFDALVCFTYALPSWSFKGNEDYSIAKMLIDGCENYTDQQIYDIFGLYVKAGTGANKKTLPGLVRRRVMEASLFLYGNTTTEVPLSSTSNTLGSVNNYNSNSATVQENVLVTETQSVSNTNDTTNSTNATWWRVNDKDGIKLRDNYGLNSNRLNNIPDDTNIQIFETIKKDGYTWGKVIYDGITGWCALDYCVQIDTPNVICDINGDGNLFVSDICMVKSYINGTMDLTDEQLKIADVNKDGVVNMEDYQIALNEILDN